MLSVSFFSYKGGAGRTSLLYNTIPFIAKRLNATSENPIIVIDLDIDSKGLSYLIESDSAINSIDVLKGNFVDEMGDYKISEHPFFKKLSPIGFKLGLGMEKNNSVLFVSANITNENNKYIGKSSNFDAEDIDLTRLYQLCSGMECKALIIDTPTGTQVSGKAALSVSKNIVTVMRITKQFRLGTYEFLRDKVNKYFNKRFYIVPNAVPESEYTGFSVSNIINGIKTATNEIVENSGRNQLNLCMLNDGNTGIGEIQLFKFEEQNLFVKKNNPLTSLSEDEEQVLKQYDRLAEELIKNG